MNRLTVPSPLGPLTVTEDEGAIVALDFADSQGGDETTLLARARDQLAAYFAGGRSGFDLPLRPHGTAFRRRVWDRMRAIPYGETLSYGDIAHAIGSAPRAVGGACGANPIPILIPCHRVVGSGGALGGYSGGAGVSVKRALLDLEAGRTAVAAPPRDSIAAAR
jgi:methylated-DNA-[protein]-cysteine S-methyltransferase